MVIPDLKRIIQVVTQLHLKTPRFKLTENRDTIANTAIYEQAVRDVLETLAGIENGNIRLDNEE